jgi:hypothetical protein
MLFSGLENGILPIAEDDTKTFGGILDLEIASTSI